MPEEAVIISTQATRHYGIVFRSFCTEEDDGQPKIRDKYTGKDMVRRVSLRYYYFWLCRKLRLTFFIQMRWYIFQGEDLRRDQRIVFSFSRTLDEGFDDNWLIFEDKLLHCETPIALKWPKDGITEHNCTLISDLRSVDRQLFKKVSLWDGTGYGYKISYDLVVKTSAANMKFSLELDGKEMGSVDAVYE